MAVPGNQYGTGAGTTRVRESPFKIGAIFGVVIAVVLVVLAFVWEAMEARQFGNTFNLISWAVMLGITGAMAARRLANSAVAGAIAGALSGFLYPIVGGLLGASTTDIGALGRQSGVTEDQARAAFGAVVIVAALILAVIWAALGALFGWLGGRTARRDATTVR